MSLDIAAVLGRLDEESRAILEKAARFGKEQGHFDVTPDHFLLHMLDDRQSPIVARMRASEVDPLAWVRLSLQRLSASKRGNTKNPAFAPSGPSKLPRTDSPMSKPLTNVQKEIWTRMH